MHVRIKRDKEIVPKTLTFLWKKPIQLLKKKIIWNFNLKSKFNGTNLSFEWNDLKMKKKNVNDNKNQFMDANNHWQ